MSMNKVLILGRLGQDPELRYTPGGNSVCNFSLATSEYWTDKSGQRQEKTEWHRVVVWGKMAELCNQYLSKGRQALVEGSLQTRSWDAKDGSKRYTTEVVAKNVQFIGGMASADSGADRAQNNQNQQDYSQQQSNSMMDQNFDLPNEANFTADDIPF